MSAVSKRYAKAVQDLSPDSAALESVCKDIQEISATLTESAELASALRHPSLDQKQRDGLLKVIGEKAGWGDLAIRTLGVLSQNDRLELCADLAEDLQAALDELNGQVAAEVTSAVALSEQQQNSLKEGIAKLTGKSVRLSTKVDPTLLGGAVTRIGSTVFDGSVVRQIALMKERISQG